MNARPGLASGLRWGREILLVVGVGGPDAGMLVSREVLCILANDLGPVATSVALVFIVHSNTVIKKITRGCDDAMLAKLSSLGGVGVPFSLLEMLLSGVLHCCPLSPRWFVIPVTIWWLCPYI